MIEAVLDSCSGIVRLLVTVHRLQQKMVEIQGFEKLGARFALWKDKFELLTAGLIQWRI